MADDISQELPPGTLLGDYTIERTLGQGGFGITYLAVDNALGTHVVIKENLPFAFAYRESTSLAVRSRRSAGDAGSFEWAVNNFLNEARTLAGLNHPNIVKVIRAFSALGTAYFVMPYIEGESLDKYREKHGTPTEAWLRALLSASLEGLRYLHGQGLLHRDIKPGNILLTADGTPQLIDFGTARQLLSEKSQTVIESPGYTPIEQMQSHGKTGPWSDLYALGCTLCKLMTGDTPPKSTDRIGKEDPLRPLAGREELRELYSESLLSGIDKALAVWPEDRWPSAGDWLSDLNNETPPAASARAATAKASRPRRRLGGACVFLLSLLASAGLVWHNQQQAEAHGTALLRQQEESQARQAEFSEQLQAHTEEISRLETQLQQQEQTLAAVPAQEEAERRQWESYRQERERLLARRKQEEEDLKLPPIQNHTNFVRFCFSADGSKLFTYDTGNNLSCWDTETRQKLSGDSCTSEQTDFHGHCDAFSPDGSKLVTGYSRYGTCSVEDASTSKTVYHTLQNDHEVTAIAINDAGTHFAAGNYSEVRLWAVSASEDDEGVNLPIEGVTALCFSPDGKTLAVSFKDGITFCDATTLKKTGIGTFSGSGSSKLHYSPDGTTLFFVKEASYESVGTVCARNMVAGNLIGKPIPHQGDSSTVIFSRDGSRFTTVENDAVCIRDTATLQPVGESISGYREGSFIALSPDGRKLAIANDSRVCVWDVETHQPIGEPFSNQGRISGVLFSPDGSKLATMGASSIRIRNIQP